VFQPLRLGYFRLTTFRAGDIVGETGIGWVVMRRTDVLGYFELVLAQCCVGSAIVMAKYLIHSIPIMLLLSLRFTICAVIMVGYTQSRGIKIHVNHLGDRLSRKDWLVLFVQAMCGGLLFNLFIVNGMHYTTATTAGIISSTIPAAITIMSIFLLKESISRNQILAIIFAVLGLVIICLGGQSADMAPSSIAMNLLGDILILLAVIPESLLTIIAKWYGAHVKPIVMAAIVLVFNAIMFIPFLINGLLTYDLTTITLFQWIVVIGYALCSVLFYQFWYKGLSVVSANTAALFTCVMPVSAAILSALFLHEVLTTTNLLGMFMVLLSIVFGANIFNLFSKPI
jgi:drug/metabolite transporter (DMT)-like permease